MVSPLTMTTASRWLLLVKVQTTAVLMFKDVKDHIWCRFAARPVGALEAGGIFEKTWVSMPVDIILMECEQPSKFAILA